MECTRDSSASSPTIEHGGGIYHVTGGLNRLSHGMAEAVKHTGGRIHLKSPVKKDHYRKQKRLSVLSLKTERLKRLIM